MSTKKTESLKTQPDGQMQAPATKEDIQGDDQRDLSEDTRSQRASRSRPIEGVPRGGRGNGGEGRGEGRRPDNLLGLRAGVIDRDAPTDTGDRENVKPADADKIWTTDSKERWGDGQPSIAEQMASQRQIEADIAEREAKG